MKSGNIVVIATIFVVFSVSNAMAFFGFFEKYQSVSPQDEVVSIPIDDVSDGNAHYYKYVQEGNEIRFFLMQSDDGVVRAAFDACDVCFREKKGYSQDGDYVVCNNCGQRFHSSRINEVRGGCNPSPLVRSYDDDTVRIRLADIMAGREYF